MFIVDGLTVSLDKQRQSIKYYNTIKKNNLAFPNFLDKWRLVKSKKCTTSLKYSKLKHFQHLPTVSYLDGNLTKVMMEKPLKGEVFDIQ